MRDMTERGLKGASGAPGAPEDGPVVPAAASAHGEEAADRRRRASAERADGVSASEQSAPTNEAEAAEIEGDLDELVKTAAERDEYLALARRTQADFENYRKRVARDSAAAQERGVVCLVKELLPALDNLDRALEEAGGASAEAGAEAGNRLAQAPRPKRAPGGSDGPLLQGVRLVRSELSAALARMGIESFSPVGERFDPSVHEAVATTEHSPAGAARGTVVEVYQPGYRLGENIIRPARVVVAA